MIFAIIKKKDADGSCALVRGNFNLEVFKKLKKELQDEIVLISNVCLCTYTSDEFCVYTEKKGKVLHEKTAEMLGKISKMHAEAGADVIAPAAMVDGQVRHIRAALDDSGFDDVPIMSYIKADSCLFDPYFEAMSSQAKSRVGVDSSKFRCDILNEKMFLQKLDLDIGEGADIVIIKPALTNLDIISLTRHRFPGIPIAAYQVSGEYAMIHDAIDAGHLGEKDVILETLFSTRRAGADMILTYDAMKICKYL
jgi:porphobilinogen synthase